MMQRAKKKNTAAGDVQILRYNIRLFIVTCVTHLHLFTGACSLVSPDRSHHKDG